MRSNVGQRLAMLRARKAVRQEVLADLIGIDRSTYSRYETGYIEADYQTLCALAEYHDVTVDFILGRTEDPGSTVPENAPLTLAELHRKVVNGDLIDLPQKRTMFFLDWLEKEMILIQTKFPHKNDRISQAKKLRE